MIRVGHGDNRGFSMLEVIVALAVVALALAIALPQLNSSPQNLGADVQDFTNNLQVGRELGVSRSVHYRLSTSAGGYRMQWCDPTQVDCTSVSSWTTERTISLRQNVTLSAPTPAIVEFDTRGYLVLQGGQSAPLTFSLVDTKRSWTKTVTINSVGMVDSR
jgi:prepilin-type N-terminal cleavage/methylation domain-containing protein